MTEKSQTVNELAAPVSVGGPDFGPSRCQWIVYNHCCCVSFRRVSAVYCRIPPLNERRSESTRLSSCLGRRTRVCCYSISGFFSACVALEKGYSLPSESFVLSCRGSLTLWRIDSSLYSGSRDVHSVFQVNVFSSHWVYSVVSLFH